MNTDSVSRAAEELAAHVRKHCSDMGGCWVWEGGMCGLQPIMWMPAEQRCRRVRQALWKSMHGKASSRGLVCRFGTFGCVCPRHLQPQKHSESIKLGLEKSTQGRALKRKKLQSFKSHFTSEQIQHIRQMVMTQVQYAAHYGCHKSTISRIQNMRTHQPVSSPFAGLFTNLIPRS